MTALNRRLPVRSACKAFSNNCLQHRRAMARALLCTLLLRIGEIPWTRLHKSSPRTMTRGLPQCDSKGDAWMAAKQLTYSDEARQKLLAGVGKLARAVRSTLGPRGRNAVLDKGWGSPTVTKDGVT